MVEILLRCRLRDVRAAAPEKIFYSSRTCWWSHDPQHLCTHPSGLPCDPRGGVLLETSSVGGDALDFLRSSEAAVDAGDHPYGKHGLLALEAAHHMNCVVDLLGRVSTCLESWDEYNDAIDIALRRPTFAGPNSKAYLLEPHIDPKKAQFDVASVLVHQPGVHAAWSWWQLSCVHLRLGTGDAAWPKLDHQDSSHEIAFLAIDPDGPTPDPADRARPWTFLSPVDLSIQVRSLRDTDARQLLMLCAQQIGEGRAIADGDARSYWERLIGGVAPALAEGAGVSGRFFSRQCPTCGSQLNGRSLPKYLHGNPLCNDPSGCWIWRNQIGPG